jgi:hypothetical protein
MPKRIIFALSVGLFCALGDLLYHWALVRPLEVPAYYVAKFVFGFIIAFLVAGLPLWISALGGGLAFTGLLSLWYYFAFLTGNPSLSSCVTNYPSYNCDTEGLPSAQIGSIAGYPITATTLAEPTVHFLLFVVGYFLAYFLVFS